MWFSAVGYRRVRVIRIISGFFFRGVGRETTDDADDTESRSLDPCARSGPHQFCVIGGFSSGGWGGEPQMTLMTQSLRSSLDHPIRDRLSHRSFRVIGGLPVERRVQNDGRRNGWRPGDRPVDESANLEVTTAKVQQQAARES